MEISNDSSFSDQTFLNITEFQKIFGHDPGKDKFMIKLAIVGYPGTGKSAFTKGSVIKYSLTIIVLL